MTARARAAIDAAAFKLTASPDRVFGLIGRLMCSPPQRNEPTMNVEQW